MILTMPDNLSLTAYAKLNLSLDITGKMPDGYHTINTVMQSIDLADTVTVERCDPDAEYDVEIICNDESIPTDGKNSAYKAAKAFFEYNDITSGSVKIKIKKNIPAAAGLGGGSADAAAVIVAMNELFNTNLESAELCDIAENVGMDVPFCINGGTQLAEGLGTILTPLPGLEGCAFLLIKNGEKKSTEQMYADFDSMQNVMHPESAQIVESICEGELLSDTDLLYNVFEPLWGDDCKRIKQSLTENGALYAGLTGSGPTVFGIFADEDDAKHAKSALEDIYDEVYLCEPVDCGSREK